MIEIFCLVWAQDEMPLFLGVWRTVGQRKFATKNEPLEEYYFVLFILTNKILKVNPATTHPIIWMTGSPPIWLVKGVSANSTPATTKIETRIAFPIINSWNWRLFIVTTVVKLVPPDSFCIFYKRNLVEPKNILKTKNPALMARFEKCFFIYNTAQPFCHKDVHLPEASEFIFTKRLFIYIYIKCYLYLSQGSVHTLFK